ncbi:MAG TPA: carbamoyltransferase HypF [Coriobacteriia bacterium]|nr:carbamoyltransferase HypF [Coriobacteriia bacterium]
MPTKALQLHVTGIVQGVGFRPFVYNLAVEQGLAGWVLNASDGVHCVVEGTAEKIDAFPRLLRERAPAMSVIERVFVEEVEPEGFAGFEIRESHAEEGAMTLVSPDIATCPDCLGELFEPSDRRSAYPFINCTNCGPRFTIIGDVPYDRPMTTMRDFPMCERCAAEYADPADRRFHAQPDACYICGPRLYLNAPDSPAEWVWSPELEVSPRPHREAQPESDRTDAILADAAARLARGEILAIKGLGGFHLACSATDPAAVNRLRERKHRWGKPLAIMARDVDAVRAYCRVDSEEAGLLEGNVRPIVLLRRLTEPGISVPGAAEPLADGVAHGLAEIGVMLPYTPLHHLLLRRVDGPLVMTSGNLSDEPIATGNAEALGRLASIADAFLLHDREIYSRYDDSVVRVVEGIVEQVRRSRGYAPHPLPLPFNTDTDILAAGPEQKNTFTLLRGEYAFVSQHIGDMENAETLQSFEDTLGLYERLFRIEPRIVAHDLHPEYLSTKWALGLDLPKVGVQHHHAHVVSVTAEHGISEPVVGVAFDGTGYGEDGRIWGGEVLVSTWTGYERFAHLRYVPMPGGAAAIRRPARMALGTLNSLDLLDHPGAAPLRSRLAVGEERTVLTIAERGVNSPLTSSMGRLFDTVAAIVGVADDAHYEGEAAILLEACADPSARGSYEFALMPPVQPGGPLIIDPTPVLSEILEDVAAQIPQGVISTRFHRAVVGCIVSVCMAATQSAGTHYVALAGGVFMNRIVFAGAVRSLSSAGLTPLTHVRLPVNDAAVSFGQAVVAWARRHEVC